MPISEDEFDYRQEAQSTMSKAELRKTHKPIMEKRRRARINHCLNEIKTLILEAMKKDPARHSKLEKADILEMAVKHLQNVQRQQLAVAISTDPSVLRKFKNGFDQCATEINRFVSQIEGVDTALRQRINQHLTKCIKGIEQIGHVNVNFPSFANLNLFGGSGFFRSEAGESSGSSGDQNNNPRIQLPQGLQLIPSRLPTGEFALLVPNSSSLPFLPHLGESRPSAFVSVVPSSCNKCPSPVQSPQTSPKGFKPVGHKSAFTPTFKQEPLQHQVPQVTSTSLEKNPELLEVKTLKYPIHTYTNAEKERQAVNSPKQEALVTITNQSERYKQAQMKPDSVNFEENQSLPGSSKRSHPDLNFDVPIVPIPKRPKIVVGPSFQVPLLKIVEPLRAKEDFCGLGKTEKQEKGDGSGSSNGGSSGEQNDMWRPW